MNESCYVSSLNNPITRVTKITSQTRKQEKRETSMAAYGRGNEYGFHRNTNPFEDDIEDEFEQVNGDEIRRQMQMSKERTLDSTNRCLALIEESHDLAVGTGGELQLQGEKLNRIERNLDKIENEMTIANRHVASVNSIWGAIGNYFKKAPKPKGSAPQSPPSSGITDLQTESSLYYGAKQSKPRSYRTVTGIEQFERSSFSSRDPHEREIDANLDLMSRGLGRLKEDAVILGGEIERQNEQLDRIGYKTDKAHEKVQKSDRKIRQILRK